MTARPREGPDIERADDLKSTITTSNPPVLLANAADANSDTDSRVIGREEEEEKEEEGGGARSRPRFAMHIPGQHAADAEARSIGTALLCRTAITAMQAARGAA